MEESAGQNRLHHRPGVKLRTYFKISLKIFFIGLFLSALTQAHAAFNEDEKEDDSESILTQVEKDDESSSDLSMQGSLLLGTPSQGRSPQVNETSYYLNLEPEWKLTENLAVFGAFNSRQSLTFDEGLYFNQSDIGIKYSGPELLGYFFPTYSLAILLPFNSQDVIQDSYRGGTSPSIKFTHANPAKTSETSLAVSYTLLRHTSETTVDDLSNVHSNLQATLAGECQLSKMWTVGGNLNYAVRHFYEGEDHSVTGFDIYNLLHVFSDTDSAVIVGFSNNPNPLLPQDLTEANHSFNQDLNFIYLGITFAL